jgi:hypothetical protein
MGNINQELARIARIDPTYYRHVRLVLSLGLNFYEKLRLAANLKGRRVD